MRKQLASVSWDIAIPLLLCTGFTLIKYLYTIPRSDTLELVQYFHTMYGHLVSEGRFPLWIPWNFGGTDNQYFQLWGLSCFQYLAMAVGVLFQISDTKLLYFFSVCLEQGVLIYGLHLLGTQLGFLSKARLFVTTAAVLSILWDNQIAFSMRFYYLLPLGMHWLLLFCEKRQWQSLFHFFILLAFSLLGTPLYILPALGLVYLLFFLAVFWIVPKKVANEKKPFVALGLTSLATLCLLSYLCLSALDHLTVHAPHRLEQNLAHRDLFLTQSVYPLDKFWELFYGVLAYDQATSLFMGISTFALLLTGIVYTNHRIVNALLLVSALLTLVGLGRLTPLAGWLYDYFPLFNRYWHLGHLLSIVKLLWILIAGWGFHLCLNHSAARKTLLLCVCLISLVFLISRFHYRSLPYPIDFNPGKISPITLADNLFLATFIFSALLLALQLTQRRSFAFVTWLWLFCELTVFQWRSHQLLPKVPLEPYDQLFDLHAQASHLGETPKQRALRLTQLEQFAFPLSIWAYPSFAVSACDYPNIRLSVSSKALAPYLSAPNIRQGLSCEFGKIHLLNAPKDSKVKTLREGMDRVEYSAFVSGSTGASLAIRNAYHPKWRATLNGHPHPIEEENGLIRLALPPGRQTITLHYHHPVQWVVMHLLAIAALLYGIWVTGKLLKRIRTTRTS